MLGLLPEPSDGLGHYLEDVEAALVQAEISGRVAPRERFIEVYRSARVEEVLGSLL